MTLSVGIIMFAIGAGMMAAILGSLDRRVLLL